MAYGDTYTYTGSNPWIDALIYGGKWSDTTPTVTLTWYAQSGADPYGYIDEFSVGQSWYSYELAALEAAFEAWEAVANIDFQRVTQPAEADLWYWVGQQPAGTNVLGWHHLPVANVPTPLYGVFFRGGYGWTEAGLQPGGTGFQTILHEVGHGLGLAHPHDPLGDSGVFPGVSSAFGDYGDYDLNQGVYTVMSYNDGWASEYPNAWTGPSYGSSSTPMALDIAAIQMLYGANLKYATGDDLYLIPGVNAAGTAYSCIWDAGGVDTMSAAGISVSVTIDLRPATLVGEGAGGWVSSAQAIYGGFTIAAGVVIENALGGGGHDTIRGNAAANRLEGAQGNDSILGDAGADTILGGGGDDRLWGGDANDWIDGGSGAEWIEGGGASDNLLGGLGDDTMIGGAGNDRIWGGAGNDVLFGGEAVGDTPAPDDDRLWGDAGNDRLEGGSGADSLNGGDGDDTLVGGAGADTLRGGAGGDVFVFTETFGSDLVVDFDPLFDFIDLSQLGAVVDWFDLALSHLSWGLDGVRIDDGAGNMAILQGVELAALDEAHFLF